MPSLENESLVEAGAFVVATVAYPNVEEEHHRDITRIRLIARLDLATGAPARRLLVRSGANGPQVPVDHRALMSGYSSLDRRIRRRVDAGRLAVEPLVARESGEMPADRWGDRWNRSKSMDRRSEEFGFPQVKNFEHRWWKTTMPVIHIAAAWATMLLIAGRAKEPSQLVDRLMTDPAYLDEFLARAQAFENLVIGGDVRAPADGLIRFRNWGHFLRR